MSIKKHIDILIFAASILLFWSCNRNSLLENAAYCRQVENDFAEKKKLLPKEFFSIFDSGLTKTEDEALMFLYAYMPLNDAVDYNGDFYLKNVQCSMKAREEMNWGKKVPSTLFRHFVLPVRVNNENLDASRMVFYEELKERVKDISMRDAILEVNHWAHEKVVYTPSDARTSSPLATLKTAYGRCGEESTFLVAALRSVGIPARQVYTPRWAHTDDNHAWVEAWADGKWHFLGACEPEPVLNLGWFNAPASRGMLMHTKVFGRYNGPEDVMAETRNYTEINVIDNYAASAKATILVVNKKGEPVSDANVEFKVYNYAEFFTVATKKTDVHGKTFLTAGKGDMLVWASKENQFGFSKVSFGRQEEVKITLDKSEGEVYDLSLDIFPPAENAVLPEVTPEHRAENTRRMAAEDSIRSVYTSGFLTAEKAEDFAKKHGFSTDIVPLLVASRGNHQTLTDFLTQAPDEKRKIAANILQLISAKDLRDITREVLNDNLTNSDNLPQVYVDRILNPRVGNEMLVPYKSYLKSQINSADAEKFRSKPQLLVEWCAREIKIDSENNAQKLIMTPVGVWKARITDKRSRDIFFVALARSLNIPAWIDEVTGKVKYVDFSTYKKSGKEIDVDFDNALKIQPGFGMLKLNYKPLLWLENPKYATHFTVSRFENGTFGLLNYDDSKVNWQNTFSNGTKLETGYYMLTTGTRLASGGVLAHISFFNIENNKTTQAELKMREDPEKVQIIGSFNSESIFTTPNNKEMSLLQACGRGYYVVAVLGVGDEPSNHALRNIISIATAMEKWGRPIIFLFTGEQQLQKFDMQKFTGLPRNVKYGTDKNHAIQKEITENLKLSPAKGLPIIMIADTFNRVVFVSQGYNTGLGEQMLKIIKGLQTE